MEEVVVDVDVLYLYFGLSLLMEPAEWQSGSWHLRENLISEIKNSLLKKPRMPAAKPATPPASQTFRI